MTMSMQPECARLSKHLWDGFPNRGDENARTNRLVYKQDIHSKAPAVSHYWASFPGMAGQISEVWFKCILACIRQWKPPELGISRHLSSCPGIMWHCTRICCFCIALWCPIMAPENAVIFSWIAAARTRRRHLAFQSVVEVSESEQFTTWHEARCAYKIEGASERMASMSQWIIDITSDVKQTPFRTESAILSIYYLFIYLSIYLLSIYLLSIILTAL